MPHALSRPHGISDGCRLHGVRSWNGTPCFVVEARAAKRVILTMFSLEVTFRFRLLRFGTATCSVHNSTVFLLGR